MAECDHEWLYCEPEGDETFNVRICEKCDTLELETGNGEWFDPVGHLFHVEIDEDGSLKDIKLVAN